MSEFQDRIKARVTYLRQNGKLADADRLEQAGKQIAAMVEGLPEPDEEPPSSL